MSSILVFGIYPKEKKKHKTHVLHVFYQELVIADIFQVIIENSVTDTDGPGQTQTPLFDTSIMLQAL